MAMLNNQMVPPINTYLKWPVISVRIWTINPCGYPATFQDGAVHSSARFHCAESKQALGQPKKKMVSISISVYIYWYDLIYIYRYDLIYRPIWFNQKHVLRKQITGGTRKSWCYCVLNSFRRHQFNHSDGSFCRVCHFFVATHSKQFAFSSSNERGQPIRFN